MWKGWRKVNSKKFKLILECCFCGNNKEVLVDLPNGWKTSESAHYSNYSLCEDHSNIYDFIDKQCFDCCFTFGKDCKLWKSFACHSSMGLDKKDLEYITAGICPKKVKDEMCGVEASFGCGYYEKFKDIDTSKKTNEGIALSKAIKEYCLKYMY